MDPNLINQASWLLIDNTITKLTIFVVLMVIGAFSMMLSRAVIPSLQLTGDITESYRLQRQVLLALGIIAFALAVFQLVRVVVQLIAILTPFYPRFGF